MGEKTSISVISSCSLILFGYIVGINGEPKFSLIGTIFGVSSSVFSTLYFIYIKKTLLYVTSSWELMYYNNVNAVIILPIVFYVTLLLYRY